jgi:hypothetical protein
MSAQAWGPLSKQFRRTTGPTDAANLVAKFVVAQRPQVQFPASCSHGLVEHTHGVVFVFHRRPEDLSDFHRPEISFGPSQSVAANTGTSGTFPKPFERCLRLPGCQSLHHLRQCPGFRHFAIRRQLVHHVRQHLRKNRRELALIHSGFRSNVLQRLAVQHVLQLIRGDWQILAGANPRCNQAAEPLLEHLLESGNSADLWAVDVLQQHSHRASVLPRLCAASQSGHSHHIIQKSHALSPFASPSHVAKRPAENRLLRNPRQISPRRVRALLGARQYQSPLVVLTSVSRSPDRQSSCTSLLE